MGLKIGNVKVGAIGVALIIAAVFFVLGHPLWGGLFVGIAGVFFLVAQLFRSNGD